jgi:hypothetical protein
MKPMPPPAENTFALAAELIDAAARLPGAKATTAVALDTYPLVGIEARREDRGPGGAFHEGAEDLVDVPGVYLGVGLLEGGQLGVGEGLAALGVVLLDEAALLDELDDLPREADDGGGDLADGADRAEGLHADGEAGLDEEGLDVGVAGAGWNFKILHDVDEAVGEVAREAVAGEDELAADRVRRRRGRA